jgi:hypothetical protein
MTASREILCPVAQDTEPGNQVGVSAPILLSEQQVAFSTAAALGVRPAKARRWAVATAVVLAALHRLVLTVTPEKRPPRRCYSNHYDFLEDACMAREMERL